MNILNKIILIVLVFLAVSSGLTKILLMQQDVEFFGAFGFSHPILISYGVFQLLGGILLIFEKSRCFGALLVAITFIISAVVLVLSNKLIVALITCVAILMLGFIIKQSLNKAASEPETID